MLSTLSTLVLQLIYRELDVAGEGRQSFTSFLYSANLRLAALLHQPSVFHGGYYLYIRVA